WKAVKPGKALELAFPAGLKADVLQIVLLPKDADVPAARAAGASIGAKLGKDETLVLADNHPGAAEVALGLALRAYEFTAYKSRKSGDGAEGEDGATGTARGRVTFMHKDPEVLARASADGAALA